jgi:hypothetical protein
MMTEQQSDFTVWLEANPFPDVQDLAKKYGGLGLVPCEAWTAYGQALENWRARFRARAVGSATR